MSQAKLSKNSLVSLVFEQISSQLDASRYKVVHYSDVIFPASIHYGAGNDMGELTVRPAIAVYKRYAPSVLSTLPIFIIDFWSATSPAKLQAERMNLYLKHGIAEFWQVDIRKKSVLAYRHYEYFSGYDFTSPILIKELGVSIDFNI